jgi:hypothetical protein
MDKHEHETIDEKIARELREAGNWVHKTIVDDDGQETTILVQNPKPFKQAKSYASVLKSGESTFVTIFEKPIYTKAKGSPKLTWRTGRRIKAEVEADHNYKRKFEVRKRAMIKARDKIKRYCRENFNKQHSKFLTLTFSDNATVISKKGDQYIFKFHKDMIKFKKNVKAVNAAGEVKYKTKMFNEKVDFKNLDHTNQIFSEFTKRMRGHYPDFKYITVIEFQDSTEFREVARGAVHYHMLTNLPYIKNKKIAEELWGWGYVLITDIKNVDNLGDYISSYITESLDDFRLEGRKTNFSSRNLTLNEPLYSEEAYQAIKKIEDDDHEPLKDNVFETPDSRFGRIQYIEYHDKVRTKTEKAIRKERLDLNHNLKHPSKKILPSLWGENTTTAKLIIPIL